MAMNAQDLCAIQDCMIGYKKIIEWMPVQNEMEAELKSQRIDIINHIVKICDNELIGLSDEYHKE